MSTIFNRLKLALAVGFMAAVGCTVGPDYHQPKLSVGPTWAATDAPNHSAVGSMVISQQPTSRPSTIVAGNDLPDRWWTTLKDSELDSLIDRATRSNLDLATAIARVREARAGLAGARAALYPTASAGASHQYDHGAGPIFPLDTGDYQLVALGFDASWELDVFGGVRRGIEAAGDTEQAQIESGRDVLVTLLAEVCRDYINLRTAQRRADIAREDVAIATQLLDLSRRLRGAGLAGDLDVQRARAQVTNTAAVLPLLDAQAQQLIHALGVLLGDLPDSLLVELSPEAAIPQSPRVIPVGLPSGLLRRRPDVRRVERQLAAATAQIGVAEADLYPQFSLTGVFGLAGLPDSSVFNWSSRVVSVGPTARWLLFDAGRVLAEVDARRAVREELLANYKLTILSAVRDVEDAEVAFDREQDRRELYRQTVDSNAEAVRIATEQYSNGVTPLLDLLDAQRSLFASQDAMAQSDGAIAIDLVALYKSLGGGWETTEKYAPQSEESARPPMPAAQLVRR